MSGIFISYRRDDAGGHAGRLCDRLTARFGDDRVFMDIQDIRPGQNFEHSIDETIAACDCVLAVIGPRWLDAVLQRNGAEDFVRRELAAALKRNVTLIPVLVGGARMPALAQLPAELAGLSRRNAVEIRDEHFEDDVARLTTFLTSTLGTPVAARPVSPRRPTWLVAGAIVIVAAAAGGILWSRRDAAPVAASTAPAAVTRVVAPDAALDGVWIAEMQRPGQPVYRVRLEFHGGPGGYIGAVRYPTGDGSIQDVVVDGAKFSFKTVHLPQFESEPATIPYQGELTADEMRLTTVTSGGVTTGIARREPATAPNP